MNERPEGHVSFDSEETLDRDAIKSCLVPDSTITPFVKNRKSGTSPSDSKRHK